jgi:antitoxin (DNA-binding transcriptional repressor) of toxin-antitoxin stability system
MKKMAAVVKHGKPVAKLVPADKDTDDFYGFMAGKGKIVGDVVAPAFSPEEWGDLYFPSRPRRPRR